MMFFASIGLMVTGFIGGAMYTGWIKPAIDNWKEKTKK